MTKPSRLIWSLISSVVKKMRVKKEQLMVQLLFPWCFMESDGYDTIYPLIYSKGGSKEERSGTQWMNRESVSLLYPQKQMVYPQK